MQPCRSFVSEREGLSLWCHHETTSVFSFAFPTLVVVYGLIADCSTIWFQGSFQLDFLPAVAELPRMIQSIYLVHFVWVITGYVVFTLCRWQRGGTCGSADVSECRTWCAFWETSINLRESFGRISLAFCRYAPYIPTKGNR